MQVEMWAIERIKPYDRNPRRNEKAVDAVARSLKAFGFRQPIVVDKEGTIIVGHTRFKAAVKLGYKEVPIHVATDLSPDQVAAYRLADNRVGEIAEWDTDLLPSELAALRDAKFDLSVLGFTDKDLAEAFRQFDTTLGPGGGVPQNIAATVHCPKCGHEFPLS
jgi:ParB-like chromosome segregation protein Spo0J